MVEKSSCEYCSNYVFDEEDDESYGCVVVMDEDDYGRLMSGHYRGCPYFSMGDEYKIVRHQM